MTVQMEMEAEASSKPYDYESKWKEKVDMNAELELEIRYNALNLAHTENETPEQVVNRARQYLAFIEGDQEKEADPDKA